MLLLRYMCLLLIALCMPSIVSAGSNPIAKVVLATGTPLVERNEQLLSIKRDSPLYLDDQLITPIGSRLLIKFTDKTTLAIAENTRIDLKEYSFTKNGSSNKARFALLRGAFRTVTGLITKQEQPEFEVETPIATIGIRGTDFWGGTIFGDKLDVIMLEGRGIYIKNSFGTVEINKPGLGSEILPDRPPGTPKSWSKEKLTKAAESTTVGSPQLPQQKSLNQLFDLYMQSP